MSILQYFMFFVVERLYDTQTVRKKIQILKQPCLEDADFSKKIHYIGQSVSRRKITLLVSNVN